MHRQFHPSTVLLKSRFPTQRFRFSLIAITLFLAVFGLALTYGNPGVSAETYDSGSIPPSGTIPPGTIPPGPGMYYGIINVVHVAPVAGDIDDTAIDICDSDGNTTVSGPFKYEEQSKYRRLSLGEHDWFVAPAGTDCATELHDIPPFNVFAGSKLVLVLYGGANGYPLDSVLIVAEQGEQIYFLPIVNTSE